MPCDSQIIFNFTFTNENRNQIEYQTEPGFYEILPIQYENVKTMNLPNISLYFMTKKVSYIWFWFFSVCFLFFFPLHTNIHTHGHDNLQHFNLTPSTLIIISVSMFVIAYFNE